MGLSHELLSGHFDQLVVPAGPAHLVDRSAQGHPKSQAIGESDRVSRTRQRATPTSSLAIGDTWRLDVVSPRCVAGRGRRESAARPKRRGLLALCAGSVGPGPEIACRGTLVQMLATPLEQYRTLLASLPLEPLAEKSASRDGDVAKSVRAFGERVSDRVMPGLDISALSSALAPLGWPVPDELIQWFEWSNGHRGGIYDADDDLACFLPYGRHLGIEDAVSATERLGRFLVDAPGPVEQGFVLCSISGRRLVVDCPTGHVWGFEFERGWDRLFLSLSETVEHCIQLVASGWIVLSPAGSVRMLTEREVNQRGHRFESDKERYAYEILCQLPTRFPRSARGELA